MKETNQGMVIPFALPGSRMRRSAQEYRRRGQVLEALSLVRRAAEQEDTAAGWQALAAELRQLGCWEAAAVTLGRVLSREDHAPSAWLDMARCQAAMGSRQLATDCLYHQLQEDPWSPEGDAARSMLAEMDDMQPHKEPHRTERLIHRGLRAWHGGNAVEGMRMLERAVRLTAGRARLMTTIALLYMTQWDFSHSLKWLARAMRAAPQDPRVMCTMAAVLQQMGKRRAARGFLRRAMPLCLESAMEEQFLTSAWAMDAWDDLEEYLRLRFRKHPHRIPLLRAMATMQYEKGMKPEAQDTWRRILSIDPGDRRSAALLEWSRGEPSGMMPMPGHLPQTVVLEQRRRLSDSAWDSAELMRHGSESRMLLDWFASSGDPEEAEVLMSFVQAQPDRKAEISFHRELLTRPDTAEPVRRRALVRLAEMQHFEPLTMLMGDRYTVAQCQPVRHDRISRPWRAFLPLLLKETRRYGESMEIAHFAAELWRMMKPEQRLDAAAGGGYLWCRAFEVLWLRQTGREDEAVRVVRRMPVSARRVSRVLRQLGRALESCD